MKDFDTLRAARPQKPQDERTFLLGGETFVLRDRVRPEAYSPMDDLKAATRDRHVCSCDHPRVAHGPGGTHHCQHPGCDCESFNGFVVEQGSTMQEVIDSIDTTFLAMVEADPDTAARYRALREREWDIIEIDDLRSVVEWMISESTSRPTGLPSSSTGSPVPTGASSTADSSSLAVQAA